MKVGIVGATGAVGQTLLELFSKANISDISVRCYASERSAGCRIRVGDIESEIHAFSPEAVRDCDVIFLCVSGDFSLKHGEALAKHSTVIDNSSAFRTREDIPLIVPPVNGHVFTGQRLIANPNCSSAIALVALAPIHRMYGIEFMIVSTYQAASGAGKAAMDELRRRVLEFSDYEEDRGSEFFTYDLAFNVIPQVDVFQDNLYTREEMKVVWEIRKVLGAPDLPISTTAVRVPTLRSHAESITLKLKTPVADLEDVREMLRNTRGVSVRDDVDELIYPMPLNSTCRHDVQVGRIRHNLIFKEYGLDLFLSGDQLLRGAALNAFEIYELVTGTAQGHRRLSSSPVAAKVNEGA